MRSLLEKLPYCWSWQLLLQPRFMLKIWSWWRAFRQISPIASLIVGRYAYVADYISGLRVVDISDPYSPEQMVKPACRCSGPCTFQIILLAGCAVDLYILDVNDLSESFILGFTMIPGWAQYCYMKDSLVYNRFGSGSHGLSYVNIFDPSNPVLLGNYFTSGAGEELLIRDEVVYLADYDAAPSNNWHLRTLYPG